MLLLLKLLKKLTQLFLNLLFLTQIILMILVFFTAAYWFFTLIGIDLFSFAAPLAASITGIMRTFYTPKTIVNDIVIDSSLLLFDVIAIIGVIILNWIKRYTYRFIGELELVIIKLKQVKEDNFNKALKKETDRKFSKYNKAALLIELKAEDLITKKYKNKQDLNVREVKEDFAFDSLMVSMRKFQCCKLDKINNKLMITINDFSEIDNIIYFVEEYIKKLQKKYREENLELSLYASLDAYDDKTNIKDNMYSSLEKILNLKIKDKIICYGSFRLRYQLNPEQMYTVTLLNGGYVIDGGTDIYILIKKN